MSSNFDNFTANIAAQGVSDSAQNSMSHQAPPHSNADQTEVEQAEAKRFLREGINAAKTGNRSDARLLLLEAAHLDANNESVWLWLASISEQPAELFEFLRKVLEINPENARAREWHGQTRNLLVNTEIGRGAALVKENERTEAAECFRRATEYDSTNETAWLWRASVADELEDKLAFLQRILHLNPGNEKAAASFHAAKRQMARNLLKSGSAAAVSGDLTTAREILADVMEYDSQLEEAWMLKAFLSETVVEKAECFIKVLEINPENLQASSGLAALRAMLGGRVKETAVETVEEKIEEVVEETLESNEPEAVAEFESPEIKTSENFSEEVVATEEAASEEVFAETLIEEPQMQTLESQESFAPAPAESQDFSSQDFSVENQPEVNFFNENQFAESNAPEEFAAEESEELRADEPQQLAAEETIEQVEENFVSETSAEFQPEQFVGETQESETETIWENQETAATVAEANEPVAELSAFSQLDPFSAPAHDEPESNSDESSQETEDYSETKVSQAVETQSVEDFQGAEVSESVEDFQDEDFQTATVTEEPFAEVSANEDFVSEMPQETADFQVSETAEETVFVEEQPEQEFSYAQAEEQIVEQTEEQTVSFVAEEPVAEPEFVETCGCPFCAAQNPVTAARCAACKAFVSMDESDNLLVHDTLDDGAVRQFIERLHQEQTARELQPQEYVNLGFAYLNLKNFKKGAQHFERAAEIAPDDQTLCEKVHRWLAKLHEIAPELLSGAASSGKTIMVVDDSPTVRKLIMSKLEKHGHRVAVAIDGMDALSKINDVNPDLVLLDVTMPRLDGYQLCKLIRQNAQTKHIPVVMISGKDGFFDKVRGRMAGSTAYITKPFGPETLLQTVETYCK